MVLNDREIKILEKFYLKKIIKIADLAKEFEITERMIRYNIEKINVVLKFLKLENIKKLEKGVFILNVNKDNKDILEIIKKLEPINKEKREVLIQFEVSFSKKSKTITYFQQYYNVSRMTIINDIKYLNKINKEKKIKFIQQKGLVIFGDNAEIKQYKLSLLTKQIEYLNKEKDTEFSTKLKNIIFENIKEPIFYKIKKFINDVINDYDIKFNDINYNMFFAQILYIFITSNGNNNVLTKDNFLETKEYEYTYDKLKKLSLIKNLSDIDIHDIANTIVWFKSYEKYEEHFQNWLNVEIIAKNIIFSIEKEIKINISKDNLLYEFLIHHLKALMHRINFGYKLKKEEIEEISREKDELYKIIKKSTNIIKNIFNNDLNDDEIFLLRTHFLASIERVKKIESKPKEIMVVTSAGPGSRQILINNIKSNFLVDIVYVGPLFKLKSQLKERKVKYILTTIDIKTKVAGSEIVKINTILTEDDKNKLIKLGFITNSNKIMLSDLLKFIDKNKNITDKEKLAKEIINNFGDKIIDNINNEDYIENMINLKNIIFDYNPKNIEQAIKKGCLLLEKGYIDNSYTKEVLDIFKNNSSHIIRYNGVIFPHTKNKGNVFKTGISIICFKNPLILEETMEKIDTVLTFVIKDEKKNLNMVSNVLSKAFQNKFKDILKEKNKTSLIEYLEEKR